MTINRMATCPRCKGPASFTSDDGITWCDRCGPNPAEEKPRGRDIIAAAETLKNASPEDLQMYAKHDWDMIREVAAVAFAYCPRTKDERTDVDAVGTVQSKNEVAGIIFCALDPALKNGIAQQRTAVILKRLQDAGYVFVNWVTLAQALIKVERDPKIKDQEWFDFMGKAQRLLRLMSSDPDHFRIPPDNFTSTPNR